MPYSRVLVTTSRGLGYLLLICFFALTGAQGQQTSPQVRIGLRTRQAETRLQATVPAQVLLDGKTVLEIPAEQVIIFRAQPPSLTVSDANEQVLLTSEKPVRVRINPAAPEATTTPLIRLLGATRHYDGKADRLYRGSFTILPQKEGLTVVNVVDLESYLCGVVSSEMSPGYPKEALKAQAVAARTYAMKHIGRQSSDGYDMDDTARFQVYGGVLSEDPRTTQAVNETAGMVLVYGGALIDAVYSSTCGGITESAEKAWGKPSPYLQSFADCGDGQPPAPLPKNEQEWGEFFKTARAFNCLQPKYAKTEAFRWVKLVTRKELEAELPEAYRVGAVQKIVPLQRGASGRIIALRLEGSDRAVTIEKELPIRNAFGRLRSSAFTVESYPDENGMPVVFAFWGGGWGHGIGMCQVGAVGLAEQGWSYNRILAHYYRGASLEKR